VPQGTIEQPLTVDDDAKLEELAAAIVAEESLEVIFVESGPGRWRIARFGMMTFEPRCPGE
jgi:hypothetical protein